MSPEAAAPPVVEQSIEVDSPHGCSNPPAPGWKPSPPIRFSISLVPIADIAEGIMDKTISD